MKFETVLLAAGLALPASGALAEPVTLIRDAKTLAGDTSLSADELQNLLLQAHSKVAIACSGSVMTVVQVRPASGTNALVPTRSQQRTAKLDY